MIELVATEHDDVGFLMLAQRIINGAVAELRTPELFLVHIDNWFDHKWLGWRSRGSHRELRDLRVPLFTPNRVRSEKHFKWDGETSTWSVADLRKPLHVPQPGRTHLAKPINRFSMNAAFVWYSGDTTINTLASLLFYLSGADGYAWYASFKKVDKWRIDDECRITRRTIEDFEARGARMESHSKKWTPQELLALPLAQRDAILAEQAADAAVDYAADLELTRDRSVI